ncbi:hypothetical protein A3D00_03070 [Candidatus Woesebacteria bacterium RIFCSPHIGHO2_02_FULL_38_9]|uniref:Leucine--tRNA ligase n=1 Tax=Candidatus Woesebacteria bacterium RIFCSPHIGHO2_01_FULL_39_28 TaxID=1802496 RepID=A0A1F7YEU8_9BACT|nr:MAG: hypothetical protein A2627_02800 [Candidatus Woesebacteria bacterium RIFCSPHIGHO2_01_FULL_39_28]OGM34667.1 MAG: hypothetical protein A3D00_03070 [Candidatus Woesebacteria bacterium RIFCSPHIGHO2_02_FULL_38_9]OGM58595.1 MAG: hypothetical protein A3A50_00940 [Candidatus Woesebacteria bacterium RIFCSPLOWO2_01_FULL_38_20]
MNKTEKYDHRSIEKKWQKKWIKEGVYTADIKNFSNKFYNLFMFPYPSAEGLHAGHAFSSTGSDVYGRFMRMKGKNVFQPIGYDSFGIHAENFALKIGEHPEKMLSRTIKHYEDQFKSLGHGYDWTRTVTTSDPSYYMWTEWLFLALFKAGLAYRKKAHVNFCPKDRTVLADEQVMTPKQAGKEPKDAEGNAVSLSDDLRVCERCGTVVEKRELEQWFFRITDYADRLLNNLEKIDWSQRVKIAQREWIGKSTGMIIKFKTKKEKKLEVFTTRPDTLNAVTFLAISDEKLYNENTKEKIGEFTGEYSIDPLSQRKIPIWKTNYVAPGYGTGVIMGVPAHDERDMDFAKKYQIKIINKKPDKFLWKLIEEKGWGRKHTNYHLRDWLISRQRYWGTPIPMIFCKNCKRNGKGYLGDEKIKLIHKDRSDWEWQGWWPDENLPIILPHIDDYQPEGTGRGPLANHPEYFKVKCPECGSDARRETDVSDTFLDSSWYFLRYPSTRCARSGQVPFDPDITKNWLPVDLYFGGAEHSVLHLMYARFVWMVLYDLGYFNSSAKGQPASDWEDPFPRFFAHGLMIKDGAKMSKSRGNVINPDLYISKFGADTLRLYTMFLGPMDASPDFRDSGIEGMHRFVQRIWNFFQENNNIVLESEKDSQEIFSLMHQTIKKVSEDIQSFRYNTAISTIMIFFNLLREKAKNKSADPEALKTLVLLLAPFAPHMSEELWTNVLKEKFSVHNSGWPKYNPELVKVDQVEIVVQVNGKLRGQLNIKYQVLSIKEEIEKLAKSDPKVSKWLVSKKIKKVIFVPGKLINFVVS